MFFEAAHSERPGMRLPWLLKIAAQRAVGASAGSDDATSPSELARTSVGVAPKRALKARLKYEISEKPATSAI